MKRPAYKALFLKEQDKNEELKHNLNKAEKIIDRYESALSEVFNKFVFEKLQDGCLNLRKWELAAFDSQWTWKQAGDGFVCRQFKGKPIKEIL